MDGVNAVSASLEWGRKIAGHGYVFAGSAATLIVLSLRGYWVRRGAWRLAVTLPPTVIDILAVILVGCDDPKKAVKILALLPILTIIDPALIVFPIVTLATIDGLKGEEREPTIWSSLFFMLLLLLYVWDVLCRNAAINNLL